MSDKEKLEKWLKEHNGDDYCEYCRYYEETCPGTMRGGPNGLIEIPCTNGDVNDFLDMDALLEDIDRRESRGDGEMTENEVIEILTLSNDMKKKLPTLQEVYKVAIKSLQELQQYRSIGTVKECRKARERQMAKKPIKKKCDLTDDKVEQLVDLGFQGGNVLRCPCCNEFIVIKNLKYCMDCGQKLHWSEEE